MDLCYTFGNHVGLEEFINETLSIAGRVFTWTDVNRNISHSLEQVPPREIRSSGPSFEEILPGCDPRHVGRLVLNIRLIAFFT